MRMRQAMLMLPLVIGSAFAAPAVHAGDGEALAAAMAEASLRSRFMAAFMELKGVSCQLEIFRVKVRKQRDNCSTPGSGCPSEEANRLALIYNKAHEVVWIVQSWEKGAAAVLKEARRPEALELSRLEDQLEAARQALAELRKELAAGQS